MPILGVLLGCEPPRKTLSKALPEIEYIEVDLVYLPPPEPPDCPTDMVLIEGDSYPAVLRGCLYEDSYRCKGYSEKVKLFGKPEPMRYCMDRYEAPNQEGAKPLVGMTWYEARDACQGQGKRLCTEAEWTLACESPYRMPYPYGLERNSAICNIDRPYIYPDNAKLNTDRRQEELDRLSQSVPSGSMPCMSAYGVYDLTGNVDEWTLSEPGHLYQSSLKGGWWGPVRNRCRPATRFHNEAHHGYQIGYRCCSSTRGSFSTAKH